MNAKINLSQAIVMGEKNEKWVFEFSVQPDPACWRLLLKGVKTYVCTTSKAGQWWQKTVTQLSLRERWNAPICKTRKIRRCPWLWDRRLLSNRSQLILNTTQYQGLLGIRSKRVFWFVSWIQADSLNAQVTDGLFITLDHCIVGNSLESSLDRPIIVYFNRTFRFSN